jgi:hypothetical protein
MSSSNQNYQINLPVLHHCDERCQYEYLFGFLPANNPKYIDGKCDQNNRVIDDCSPKITDCLGEQMWQDFDEKGAFIKHDEVVITDKDIKVSFDYPLKQKFLFDFHSDQGFTRKQLVELIANTYKNIYEEEERTANEYEYTYKNEADEACICTSKVIPIDIRVQMGSLMNRNRTDGKYGIWGHDIEDLWLEGISYNPQTMIVSLSIGS